MTLFGWTSFIHADKVWFWWLYTVTQHICNLIIISLWIIHSINLFLDLCTKTRKSVNWRKNRPTIDVSYKILHLFSYLSLTLFFCSATTMALANYRIFHQYCKQLLITTTDLYIIAKQFMYSLFLVKFICFYNGSSFGYKPKHLIILITFIPSIR